ncbi:cyclic nucleotide-binding domain-containing protein [Microbaculum marinum]|uniref:Cyclic nucleotide-binding domain-containing protein n=1 Tax=Microbaculum marinum TaxID=1764581 RepID=A0AAW9RXE4_9HYPH
MTLDHDVQLLQSIPLLSDFPAEQLRLIAFSAEPLKLPADTMLFREGADANDGFVLVSGAVQFFTTVDGVEEEIAIAGPGALIGELALLCHTTRPASARTIEPTELLAVSRRLLRRVLEEYPDMAERLRQALSERLSTMTKELGGTRERLLSIDSGAPETAE